MAEDVKKVETENEGGDTEDKKPQPSDEQMFSALSFTVMLLLVGLPLWWKTTEVYRVSLPYSDIESLRPTEIIISLNIHIATIEAARGQALVDDLTSLFKISKLYNVTFKQHPVKKQVLGSSKTLDDIETGINHPRYAGSIQLMEIPGLSRFTPKPIILGQDRTIYFSTDTDALKLFGFLKLKVFHEDSLSNTILHMTTPMATSLDKDTRRRIPPSKDYDILFTVINPEPESLDVDFDVPLAIQEYITPFLSQLADVNQLHVKSQWLYFVNLQVTTKQVGTGDTSHYALAQDLLPHVITPLEKKLASHVSKNPCLNMVLWIPPCNIAPLHIYTSTGQRVAGENAFLSPKWGGIQIYNPVRSSCLEKGPNDKVLVEPERKAVMSIFLQHLRLLLGIPDTADADEVTPAAAGAHLRVWEKDALIRARTVEHLTSAKQTLQSLSKLLATIGNIVINDEVGAAITTALHNIWWAEDALSGGRLLDSHLHSKTAFLAAETAFTDPSLLALLYFPDDQKYAVYIPLFLPVMIPVLISFKQLREWIFKKLTNKKMKND